MVTRTRPSQRAVLDLLDAFFLHRCHIGGANHSYINYLLVHRVLFIYTPGPDTMCFWPDVDALSPHFLAMDSSLP